MHRRDRELCLAVLLMPFLGACGSSIRTQTSKSVVVSPAPVQTSAPAGPTAPVEDPVLTLIAESERQFQAGRQHLEQGRLEEAKLAFNRAVNVLIESSYGARTEPRIREHFDRLVERISTDELKSLASGDGFTETEAEPASIDELLALSATFDSAPATAEVPGGGNSSWETSGYDIPIPLNQRVLSYIELFQGRLHDFIEEGMRRGSRYLPMIQGVLRAEGLPLDLAYVPLVESAFKPNALSRAKARGVWQFMRGTALENGLRSDWYIDERSDPEKSTVAAARYLHTLGELFNDDWHLALASYNGGPGRVQRAVKRGRLDDFWQLASKPRLLPRETREYVPMILAAIIVARNPAQYGFSIEPEPPLAYEKVVLPRPVDLRRVAEWADTTIDAIQTLNPELRRWTTPVRDVNYELKVPTGTAGQVQQRLEEAAATELATLQWYTVKRGETLLLVAKKLRVSRADLAEANYLRVNARLAVGQRLIVPYEATTLMAARTERQAPAAMAARSIPTQPDLSAPVSANSERVKVIYEVRRGDTLSSIARLFRTTVASLRDWNRTLGKTLMPGQRLAIYAAPRVS
jgi:membrane-bound lytic murein transglycosylase D